MPKKKIIQRIPHLSTAEEKDLDFPSESAEAPIQISKELQNTDAKEEIIIKRLFIKPAGFPIKPIDAPDKLQIKITNSSLFQAYATEQWLGLSVKVKDYIFDQLIIPDFAFQVTRIHPKNASRIGAETKFVMLQPPITKPEVKMITFEEIIGNNQAKVKAQIIIEFLKDPVQFGEWAPKNILFYGAPGTGKTLTAKAIATAANCTFIARKGTTLIGLHVGDGANKIHELFSLAKKNSPAIIFIDELDSIGLNRAYQNVRGDVVEVATALLAEMDGLESSEGIITIGATNSLDLLDPGLRSRFEEEIEFPIPTESEREAMLKLFCQKVPIPLDVDYAKIAKATDKWSGRDLHEKLIKVAVHQSIQNRLEYNAAGHSGFPPIDTNILLKIIQNTNKQNQNSKPPSGLFS